jgi:hypothetical protein
MLLDITKCPLGDRIVPVETTGLLVEMKLDTGPTSETPSDQQGSSKSVLENSGYFKPENKMASSIRRKSQDKIRLPEFSILGRGRRKRSRGNQQPLLKPSPFI